VEQPLPDEVPGRRIPFPHRLIQGLPGPLEVELHPPGGVGGQGDQARRGPEVPQERLGAGEIPLPQPIPDGRLLEDLKDLAADPQLVGLPAVRGIEDPQPLAVAADPLQQQPHVAGRRAARQDDIGVLKPFRERGQEAPEGLEGLVIHGGVDALDPPRLHPEVLPEPGLPQALRQMAGDDLGEMQGVGVAALGIRLIGAEEDHLPGTLRAMAGEEIAQARLQDGEAQPRRLPGISLQLPKEALASLARWLNCLEFLFLVFLVLIHPHYVLRADVAQDQQRHGPPPSTDAKRPGAPGLIPGSGGSIPGGGWAFRPRRAPAGFWGRDPPCPG
jgi:hypothetical protein